jgi:hypothetical protein
MTELESERMRQIRKNNRRTGLWLAALALFFFVMLFVKRLWLR